VSVSLSFKLPESNVAPSVTEFIPLAGDGWTSPQSAYYSNAQVVGDATGGTATITVERDDRFSHIISFIAPEALVNTAEPFQISIARLVNISVRMVGVMPVSTIGGSALSCLMLSPPPMIDPVSWTFQTDNTDTIVFRMKFLVFNFQLDAPKRIPIQTLFASLPRAATIV
jgi:hypothetical protein